MDGIGDLDGGGGDLRSADEVGSVVVEDDAGSAAVAGVAGGCDDGDDAFVGEELESFGAELGQALAVGLEAGEVGGGWGSGASALWAFHFLEFFGGVAGEEGLGDVGGGAGSAEEDDLAGELAFEFVEVGGGLEIDVDGFAGDGALGGGETMEMLEPKGVRGPGRPMRTQVLICCQPIPNSPQSSRWAFSRPILVRVSRVQALALAMFGEPVRRGPMPSDRA